MPKIGTDDSNPKRLRLRLDAYDDAKQQYRPLSKLSVIIGVKSTRMHRPLWRWLLKELRAEAWKDEIAAEDTAPNDKPGENARKSLARKAEQS